MGHLYTNKNFHLNLNTILNIETSSFLATFFGSCKEKSFRIIIFLILYSFSIELYFLNKKLFYDMKRN